MKLLYATKNQAKFILMQDALQSIQSDSPIILSCLTDFKDVENAPETGITALENATQKAKFYYNLFQIPLFSCDTALEIENLPKSFQPGVNVRRVNGKTLTDEEMIVYYGSLAKQYGKLKCRYRNAIYLIVSKEKIYASDEENLCSERFYMRDKPLRPYLKGFPLDSLTEQSGTKTPMQAFAKFIYEHMFVNIL